MLKKPYTAGWIQPGFFWPFFLGSYGLAKCSWRKQMATEEFTMGVTAIILLSGPRRVCQRRAGGLPSPALRGYQLLLCRRGVVSSVRRSFRDRGATYRRLCSVSASVLCNRHGGRSTLLLCKRRLLCPGPGWICSRQSPCRCCRCRSAAASGCRNCAAATAASRCRRRCSFTPARLNRAAEVQRSYACHRRAVGQTGTISTLPPGGGPDPRRNVEYQRAVGACLDARGYTVK